ncbi:GFA family protein [Colwellia psychrerythraea]|uniref:Glutathione-dependent formaldehyde-activating GFA n=1 Tax=Colwellia psychrerythraea TaxID=28229 RepID=A0A099K9N2_COLPS|nr:GFA family protein [Colwellia psychrerythraea]KGJ86767.1 glutathione-dependent formaldehyde-activating GFA [Colwellia psychrerythraea]
MKGSCNCGSVSFNVSGKVAALYQCHCKLCQKQSGSTSNTATIVKESDFSWVAGSDSISHWQKASGFTSDFCKHCGCPVPNRLRESNYYWIPMGLVENVDIKITTHLCCSSKANWDEISDGGIKHDDMPPSLDNFIKSLQEHHAEK